MKNILLVMTILMNSLSLGQLLTEDFNYTAGTLLTNNGWINDSGSGVNALTVASGSLSYGSYPSSGIGNSVTMTTSGEDDYETFTSQNSGTIYASFLVNVTAAKTGDYFCNFYAAGSQKGRVYMKTSSSGFDLGLSKTGVTINYTGNTYSFNTTYLVVIKYEFISGTINDNVSLFVNPDLSGSEPSPTIAAFTDTGTDASSISGIELRQGTSATAPTLTVDGIRVATSWSQAPLPVELTSFTSNVVENKVTLNWSTATEVNNYGFEVQRSSVGSRQSAWEKIGFVNGNGNSNSPKNFSFTDEPTCGKEFQYRLKQIDFNGAFEYSEITTAVLENVSEFKLDQNFPNPFNPTTRINYTVPARTNVKLRVYDLLAQMVAELANGTHEAGRYEVTFDGSNLPSGAYFYKLEAGSYIEVKKLLLVK